MCSIIVINGGDAEIESPRHFFDAFGFYPGVSEGYKDLIEDACLCQVDIERSLLLAGITDYTVDSGDFYINIDYEKKQN